MASIIIDGYNIIGVVHKDLEGERQRLIEALASYKKGKSHEITVVFDGWKNGSAQETRLMSGGIEVIYSRLGEKADSVIKRLISGQRQHIVITSDREIQAHAWSHDSVPVDSERFLAILEGDAGSSDDGGSTPKGRTPSKKEKALKRAIEKL